MKEPEPAHSGTSSVSAALLDYFGAPGKYQLTLRQPGVLFASVREILQLASDRGAADAPQSGRLRDAANFFIRAALLYPGADHYAVLGLAPGETPTDLKERYRLLMRLIHPDFAGAGSAAWPPDAAVRVNRAYEVLSSAVLRREYDEQLAAPRSQRPAAAKAAFHAPAARRLEEPQRRLGKKAALAFGLAFGIPAVLLLMPRSEPDQLVQRQAPAASAPRALAARTEVAEASVTDLSGAEDLARTELSQPASPSAGAPTATPERSMPATTHASPPAASLVAREAPSSVARPPEAAHALALATPPTPPVAHVAPATRVAQARVAPATSPAAVRPAEPLTGPPAAKPPPAPVVPEPPATALAVVPAAAPAVVPAPAPVLASVSTTPAAVMLTAAPSAPPAAKLTTTLAAPIAAPTLAEAQPLLTQVLQMLESGSADQLLRLLDGDARKQPGAQALSRQYEQIVQGGTPVRVSQVDFQGEPRGGVLLVTGRIRLHAGEPTIGSFGQKLVVRAEFAQRAGKVQLTGLSSAPE